MKLFITYFYNVRFFLPNMIPVSTAYGDPAWYHGDSYDKSRCFVDQNGVMNGIREESFLMSEAEEPKEMCQGNPCPYSGKYPHCQFLDAYRAHLAKLDFGALMKELSRTADDVKKALRFEGEPIVVLLVHEKPDNPCSERQAIMELFESHGVKLSEWTKEQSGIIF